MEGESDMLRVEWIARLFSIILTVSFGIFLSSPDAHLLSNLFFWITLFYGILLLFKKYTYPWPLGSHYNLIVEAIELMALLYIHSASSSPLVVVLFISFILRMTLIYESKFLLPLNIIGAVFFILVDYYNNLANSRVNELYRSLYWTIGFSFLIWILWEINCLIKNMEKSRQSLQEAINIKDVLIKELNESRERLLESNDQLYIWANTDALTGLYNSRYFNRYWDNIYEQFQNFKQNNYPISLVMIDIQGHKIYNDVYGHAAGDILLQDLASIIRECVEAEDIVVRYSDYVFAVIIPGQLEGEAIQFYQRFKEKVKEYSREHPGMRNIEISIGWSSCIDVTHQTKEELIVRATNGMRIID